MLYYACHEEGRPLRLCVPIKGSFLAVEKRRLAIPNHKVSRSPLCTSAMYFRPARSAFLQLYPVHFRFPAPETAKTCKNITASSPYQRSLLVSTTSGSRPSHLNVSFLPLLRPVHASSDQSMDRTLSSASPLFAKAAIPSCSQIPFPRSTGNRSSVRGCDDVDHPADQQIDEHDRHFHQDCHDDQNRDGAGDEIESSVVREDRD